MVDQDDTIKNGEENNEEEEIQHEEVEVIDWEGRYKRALADYQNLEKRVAEQRREWILAASREVLNRLLPVLDTLLLASQHIEDKGLTVSIQQFQDVLKAEGVERIETKGQKFDPVLMEAVGTGEGKDGEVVEEARAGYVLHEKLLRPAQVIVGKGK
jgi:molecular chaperone GrpE